MFADALFDELEKLADADYDNLIKYVAKNKEKLGLHNLRSIMSEDRIEYGMPTLPLLLHRQTLFNRHGAGAAITGSDGGIHIISSRKKGFVPSMRRFLLSPTTLLSHELGHAMVRNKTDRAIKAVSRPFSKQVRGVPVLRTAASLGAVATSVMAPGLAVPAHLVASAVHLPTVAEEIRATTRAHQLRKQVGHSAFKRWRGTLGLMAPLGTYATAPVGHGYAALKFRGM